MKNITKDLYYGFLQMLTVLTATILVGGLAGISVPVILFTTGLGCIVFNIVTKGKAPIAVGCSGSWLGTMIAMSAFGLDHVVGVTILGGLFYIAFGLLIKKFPKILKIFTPLILNLAVLMIALNLIATAVGLVATAPITGIATVLTIVLINTFCGGGLDRFSFPIGVLVGTVVHGWLYGLSSEMGTAFMPALVAPAFNITTLMASLIFIALVTEALGDSKLVSEVTGKGYEPHSVIMGNGSASIFSGLFGGMSLTTYSESCAMVRVTGYTRRSAIIVCGLLFMIMAFIPQVAWLIGFIPAEALSGMLLYLFTLVAVSKIDSIKIKNGEDMTVAIVGLMAFFLAPYIIPSISQIVTGMFAMLIAYSVTSLKKLK